MLALIVKISVILFCGYISIDSFIKASKFDKEVERDVFNPVTAKIFRRRAIRTGILFALGMVVGIASLFFRIAPLGE
jgi:hypothetical protein